MRKISKLAALAEEDQKLVFSLCERNKYDVVVELLAKPRDQGGLDLKTSASALCRFASTFGHDAQSDDLGKLARYLESQPNHDPALIPNAILGLIEQRIFADLLAEKPLDKLRPAFRLMFELRHASASPAGASEGGALPEHSTTCQDVPLACGSFHPKTPAIPHLSQNSTSIHRSKKIEMKNHFPARGRTALRRTSAHLFRRSRIEGILRDQGR